MSSFSYKGILSILVSVFLVSGIMYASSTIISVQTQSIAQGDVIANGWFQEVNDKLVNIFSSGGNVGIGTLNQVLGGRFQVRVGGNKNIGFNLDTSEGSQEVRISSYNDAVSLSNPLVINGSYIRFQNNGTEAFRITNGNIGIGTTTPSTKLDITGSIKIADGTQGVGKVLTSDANGLASWNNPLDGVMNYSSQNPGALPQSAGSTVVPAGGYYDYGSFSVSPGIYMWFVYNCAGQLNYTSGGGNSYFMVGSPVIYSSSNWSNLNNTPYNTCGIIYTGVVKVNSIGIVSLRISSYQNSVLITPGPTSTAFNVSLVKIF